MSMSEMKPSHATESTQDVQDEPDAEDLTDAYEALAEDRRLQQEGEPASTRVSTPPEAAGHEAETNTAEAIGDLAGDGVSLDQPVGEATSPEAPPSGPGRRVFMIDAREYPDPGPELPITGTRSVQAMYRDYFPGQLDNVDVVQKTRPDGTLEVTFKRRIGTKGALAPHPDRASTPSSEVIVTVAGVIGMLRGLPEDRPLAWDLVEQAMDPHGAVRLDYEPPAAQLNLAEAQQAARIRLIEHAVGELRRLRPAT